MGATACWNLLQATNRLSEVLACEFIVACQALELNATQPSKVVSAMKKRIRSVVEPLDGDRSTSADIISVARELLEGTWLARVEAEVGRLPR